MPPRSRKETVAACSLLDFSRRLFGIAKVKIPVVQERPSNDRFYKKRERMFGACRYHKQRHQRCNVACHNRQQRLKIESRPFVNLRFG